MGWRNGVLVPCKVIVFDALHVLYPAFEDTQDHLQCRMTKNHAVQESRQAWA